jgi:seryl-tRNA synthetase
MRLIELTEGQEEERRIADIKRAIEINQNNPEALKRLKANVLDLWKHNLEVDPSIEKEALKLDKRIGELLTSDELLKQALNSIYFDLKSSKEKLKDHTVNSQDELNSLQRTEDELYELATQHKELKAPIQTLLATIKELEEAWNKRDHNPLSMFISSVTNK